MKDRFTSKCPYCGCKNIHRVKMTPYYTTFIATCSNDDTHHCDRTYAVQVGWIIQTKEFALAPVGPMRDLEVED